MLPPAVTLMIDMTWSVGLPSLSAASHVPASFFIFSRPALVGGGGSLTPGLSPPKLACERVNSSPHNTNRRTIFVPPQKVTALIRCLRPISHATLLSNDNGSNRHENE